MDYHQDRFQDYSLLVFKIKKLIAVLPANRVERTLHSHQGLSYGGFVVNNTIRIEDYTEAFKQMLLYLEVQEIDFLVIKKLPFIYHKHLNGELDYLMYKLEATTIVFDSYFVIDNLEDYKPNRNRKRALLKANSNNLELSSNGLELFWEEILAPNLKNKFNVKPVHTLSEIKKLMDMFPEQMKFYSAKVESSVKAGVVVFITHKVLHFQYSSGDEDRTDTSALDFLFHEIIKKYNTKAYVSFGSSSTNKTLKINKGLAYWKESFGAKTIVQEHIKLVVRNHKYLDDIFI